MEDHVTQQVCDAPKAPTGILHGDTPDEAVDLISEGQEVLRQIASVLAGDSSDESFSGHVLLLPAYVDRVFGRIPRGAAGGHLDHDRESGRHRIPKANRFLSIATPPPRRSEGIGAKRIAPSRARPRERAPPGQYNSLTGQLTGNTRFRYNSREGQDLWLVWNEVLNLERAPLAVPRLPFADAHSLTLKYSHTLMF